MNDDLLHKMLNDIHKHVESLDLIMKGDGSEDSPGVLLKLDRLVQAANQEKAKQDRRIVHLWSVVSALAVAILGPWLARHLGLAA